MALKLKTKNKKKQAPPMKGAHSTVITWPDLPQTLVDIIAKQPAMMQHISYGGLTKLFRATTSKCNSNNNSPPCLQLFDEIYNGNNDEYYVEPTLNASLYRHCFWYWSYSTCASPPIRSCWKHYFGYSNDAIVIKEIPFYLWYPVEGHSYSTLPKWDERIPLMRVVISSSPRNLGNKNCTVMVLTGTSHPAFVFCRLSGEGDMEWVKQDCTLKDPNCLMKSKGKNFMTFTNAIGFNGRFYALSLQGTLAVIDATESYPITTAISSERAVPFCFAKVFQRIFG